MLKSRSHEQILIIVTNKNSRFNSVFYYLHYINFPDAVGQCFFRVKLVSLLSLLCFLRSWVVLVFFSCNCMSLIFVLFMYVLYVRVSVPELWRYWMASVVSFLYSIVIMYIMCEIMCCLIQVHGSC